MYLLMWSRPDGVTGAEWIIVGLGVVLDLATYSARSAQIALRDKLGRRVHEPHADARARDARSRRASSPSSRSSSFLVGAIAFYLERTVLDEDGFETIATELIRSDEIRAQVAATAVEQLYANVDVEQAIAERLPEAQKALAPVLAGITRQGAEEAANRLLERPRLQEAWVRVATATQRQLVELLDDEGEFVSTTGGEVVLDLRPIIIDLGEEVAIIGRVAEQLPESTGQIAIVSSDQLETAQTGARILQALANWLWLVAIALAVLAVWLARGRRRIELRALAVGLPGRGIPAAVRPPVRSARTSIDSLTTDATEPAGSDAWRIVTQGLADRAWLAIVLGLLALAGRLARRTDTARRRAPAVSSLLSPHARSGRTAPSPVSSSSSRRSSRSSSAGSSPFSSSSGSSSSGVEVLRRVDPERRPRTPT